MYRKYYRKITFEKTFYFTSREKLVSKRSEAGRSCWQLRDCSATGNSGRDRNKNGDIGGSRVAFSSTVKVGTIFALFVPLLLLLLRRLIPLFDYLSTYVCMYVYIAMFTGETRVGFRSWRLPTNRWKWVRYAGREIIAFRTDCLSLCLTRCNRRWGKFIHSLRYE